MRHSDHLGCITVETSWPSTLISQDVLFAMEKARFIASANNVPSGGMASLLSNQSRDHGFLQNCPLSATAMATGLPSRSTAYGAAALVQVLAD